MKPSTTKQVLKDNNKFQYPVYLPSFPKKLHWLTPPLDSLLLHSMPRVHQNKSFGKASLRQIQCVFPTVGVPSTTDWLLYGISTYSSQATLFLQVGSRIAQLSPTSPLLCWLKHVVIWLIQFLEQSVLNSLPLILDKSKMTYKDKWKA